MNYLFFLPAGAETNGVAGYNPFGYNFGFIYEYLPVRLGSHELGHGIGSLHHPFDETVAVKGQTDNLMDYNDREQLWHFQWDMMQKPPKRIFKWRFEEGDAEMKAKLERVQLENPISGFFVTPSKYLLYIDNVDAINVLNYDSSLVVEIDDNVLDYAIYGFERNGFAYKAHFDGPTFIGYISDLNNKYTDECGISYWKYEDSTIARMAYDGKLKDLVPLSDRYGFIPPYPSFAYDGSGSRTEEDLELPRLIEIFMQDDILKIELRYNTCILKNLVKFKPDMTKSEWMKEFESFVCSGLLAAVIPLAGEFFVPMAIEGFALSQEETVRRFGSGFCREAVSKYLQWAFKKLAENTDSLVVCIDSIRSVNEQYPDSIDVLWTAVIPWVYSNISFAKFIEERFTVPNLDDPNNPVVDFWGDCTKAGIANLVQAEEYKLLLGCLTNIDYSNLYRALGKSKGKGDWNYFFSQIGKEYVSCLVGGVGSFFEILANEKIDAKRARSLMADVRKLHKVLVDVKVPNGLKVPCLYGDKRVITQLVKSIPENEVAALILTFVEDVLYDQFKNIYNEQ